MAGVKGRSGRVLGVETEVLSVRLETPTLRLWNALCAQEQQAAGVEYPARPLLAAAIALLARERGVRVDVKEGIRAVADH